MTNAEFFTIELPNDRTEELAVITAEDGSTISMLKSTYDAMQAEQSTPNLS